MDFGALPPEINSGRMYAGPGPGPLLAAAQAWDALAAELHIAATGYGSVVGELSGQAWSGPGAESMTAAAAPYVAWMHATALQAEETAAQARAAVAAYEAAFAMTVPPPVIAANRVQLMTLVATNFFGQNTPAIAATEIHYAEMWAQDAVAMFGYAGSSATASTVTPFTKPADTTNSSGVPAQAAAVAKATGTQAGTTAQSAAQSAAQTATQTTATSTTTSTTSQTVTATSATQVVHQVSTTAGTTTGSTTTGSSGWLTPSNFTAIRQALQAYFALGMGQFGASIGQQMFPGAAGGAGASGSAPLPGAGLPALGSYPISSPVSATAASANSIGRLSVPASWAAGTPGVNPTSFGTPLSLSEASQAAGSQGLLRGMPLSGVGRRASGGFTHRYGFRYSVMPRPPSAG